MQNGEYHPWVVRVVWPGVDLDRGVNSGEGGDWLGSYRTLDEARMSAPNRARGLGKQVGIVHYVDGHPTLIETYAPDGRIVT